MIFRRLLALILVFLIGGIPLYGMPVQAQQQQRQDLQTPHMLVIDTSGSMDNNTSVTMARNQSRTRLDLAKSSVLSVMGDLPDENPLGVISYPGNGASDSEGCSVGEMIANPRVKQDKGSLSNQVRGLRANGGTPTGPALRNAADVLTDTGADHGVIMLFTDGEANCGAKDVCEVAKQIVDEGFDVTVNTVGLDLSEYARSDMDCVARTTGGVFLHSDDPAELEQMIRDAILPELTLDVDMPAVAMRTAGPSAPGSAVPVSVGVGGNGTARDVRATLTLYDAVGDPGAILVTRPVKYFGNLNAGEERSSAFDVRAGSEQTVPDGEYRWSVTATADNVRPVTMEGTVSVTDGIDRQAFGEVLRNIEHAVVMGDSYASGEGAETSLDGYQEDGADKWCHRSSNNYGTQLFGEENTTTIACSGATAVDFIDSNEKHGARPQLDQLRTLTGNEDKPVDAVLMSIGGNDIGFGHIVARCVTGTHCDFVSENSQLAQDHLSLSGQNTMKDFGRSARTNISSALVLVDGVLNDDAGERPVIAVPYPRIITPTHRLSGAEPSGRCFAGISNHELKMLNALIDSLNESMELAANDLRQQGRPVYYARSVVEAFQPDHTICDPDPWVVGTPDSAWLEGMLSIGLEKTSAKMDTTVERSFQQLVHPNADGHAAMARSIAAWSTTTEAERPTRSANAGNYTRDPITSQNPLDSLSVEQTSGVEFIYPMLKSVATSVQSAKDASTAVWQTVTGSVNDVLVAGAESVSRVDWGSTSVQAMKITTGTSYWMMMNSEPTMIKFGVVDESGQLPPEITVPSFVPAGQHTLVLVTVSPEGTMDRFESPVTVVSAGSYLAVSGLLVGIVLLVIGLVGRLVLRRR